MGSVDRDRRDRCILDDQLDRPAGWEGGLFLSVFSPSVPPVPLHLLLLVEARRPLACDLPPETQHLHPALLFALLWSTPAGAEVC